MDSAPKKQMNVRLPEELIERIDARRKPRKLSRDQWVERALRFALSRAPGRTATRETLRKGDS